jgi:hypothetical protein
MRVSLPPSYDACVYFTAWVCFLISTAASGISSLKSEIRTSIRLYFHSSMAGSPNSSVFVSSISLGATFAVAGLSDFFRYGLNLEEKSRACTSIVFAISRWTALLKAALSMSCEGAMGSIRYTSSSLCMVAIVRM